MWIILALLIGIVIGWAGRSLYQMATTTNPPARKRWQDWEYQIVNSTAGGRHTAEVFRTTPPVLDWQGEVIEPAKQISLGQVSHVYGDMLLELAEEKIAIDKRHNA